MVLRRFVPGAVCALTLTAPAIGWAQSPAAPSNARAGLLVMVDHTASAEAAAQRCEAGTRPDSAAAIRAAHKAWQAQHSAAQQQLVAQARGELVARAQARGESAEAAEQQVEATMAMFRSASMNQLQQRMGALQADELQRFCADYAQAYSGPEMDFTSQLLRRAGPPR
jgi:hypothetical protein